MEGMNMAEKKKFARKAKDCPVIVIPLVRTPYLVDPYLRAAVHGKVPNVWRDLGSTVILDERVEP